MFWIIGFVVLGFVGLCGLCMALMASEDSEEKALGVVIIAAIVLAQIGWAGVNMVHTVDSRNVGVLRTFGHIDGQISEGFNLTFPWQTVEEYNIKLQVIEPDTKCANGTEHCMNAGSVDVQDVYINGTLNLEVSPDNVQELARNIGQNYTDTIVLNRLEQVTKAVISTYKAEDILGHREEIRADIRARMQDEMKPYSINVVDFLLTNVDFTDGFRQSIEAKVQAEVNAATERNKVAISEAQAQQQVAQAKGQADSSIEQARGEAERLRLTAQGQADANKAITSSLTPELIQWQMVQKLAPTITTMLLPSNGNFLLNLPGVTP